MDAAIVIIGVGVVAVAIVVAVVVGRFRAGATRRRIEEERHAADRLAELERTAGSALVRADERIRLADDELGFAIADFGEHAANDFAEALQRARQQLSEAFHLNQLLSDQVPDSDAQRQEWTERVIALSTSAEASLEEVQSAFTARRAAARRAPSEIERVRAELRRIGESIPGAREEIDHLSKRYSESALRPISDNVDQAEQLLEFAERSTRVAESRLSSSRTSEADTVVKAGVEAVRRAGALVAAVGAFEVEALHAEATLAAIVAESRTEITEARSLPADQRHGRIDDAIAALEGELETLPSPGAHLDPVGSLTALRRANSALDDAVAEHADRAARRERSRAQLLTAIDDAERQIAAARDLLTDYRTPVGPEARTRLAEAERELAAVLNEHEPEPAIARARRAASLAADAAGYARADVEHARRGWETGRAGPRGGGALGGVIGGLAIGGLLDGLGDLGDIGDLFD